MLSSTSHALALAAVLSGPAIIAAMPADVGAAFVRRATSDQWRCANLTHLIRPDGTTDACATGAPCVLTTSVPYNPCGAPDDQGAAGTASKAPLGLNNAAATSAGQTGNVQSVPSMASLQDPAKTGDAQLMPSVASLQNNAPAQSISGAAGALQTVVPAENTPAQGGNSSATAIEGQIAAAWVSPWDDWHGATMKGVTDLYVGKSC